MLHSPGLTPPGYFLPPCGLEAERRSPGTPLARLWEGAVRFPQAMEGLRWDVSQEISYKAHSDC
jgi:hypothetical protein